MPHTPNYQATLDAQLAPASQPSSTGRVNTMTKQELRAKQLQDVQTAIRESLRYPATEVFLKLQQAERDICHAIRAEASEVTLEASAPSLRRVPSRKTRAASK